MNYANLVEEPIKPMLKPPSVPDLVRKAKDRYRQQKIVDGFPMEHGDAPWIVG